MLFIELFVLLLAAVAAGVASIFRTGFRKAFLKSLWCLAIPPLVFAYGFIIERNIYKVKRIEISSERIPASFDGYRIVQLSDIHLGSFSGRARSLGKAVAKVNALHPDIVLFTGDLITFSPSEIKDTLATILSEINADDGVFSVLGNHDYCTYSRYPDERARVDSVNLLVSREREFGWKVLQNGNVPIVRASLTGSAVHDLDTIYVAGVRNTSVSHHFISDGDLSEAMEGAGDSFTVLMSHDPSHWRAEVTGRDDIDLMLSGHTHAMQLAFFGWSPIVFLYKEYSGLYEREPSERMKNRQYLYVNTGLGETGFPARVGVPPEITLVTLRSEQPASDF